jgi:hypothetical protein
MCRALHVEINECYTGGNVRIDDRIYLLNIEVVLAMMMLAGVKNLTIVCICQGRGKLAIVIDEAVQVELIRIGFISYHGFGKQMVPFGMKYP